jgi:hypothetical protein
MPRFFSRSVTLPKGLKVAAEMADNDVDDLAEAAD